MNWVIVTGIVTLTGVPISVTAIILQLRTHARATAQRMENMRSEQRAAGKAAMQPMIDLLTSERDDARRERDDAKRERDDARRERDLWEGRYLDLANSRRPRPGGL